MTRMILRLVSSAVLVTFGFACTPLPIADVIYTGGTIHTLDQDNPVAQAVAAVEGVLIYVGSAAGAERYRGPETRFVELDGAVVLPGLTDSHVHLSGVGAQARMLDLRGVDSLTALLTRVRPRVAHARPGEWIVGRGWIETFWEPAVFPSRFDLDAISPDNPVFLVRIDGHGAVANSKALEVAGIHADLPNPFGGEILRDETGDPTGMLLDNALDLVWAHVAPTSDDELREHWRAGAQEYVARGWTGVQEAGVSWREKEIVQELVEAGELPLRVFLAVDGPGDGSDRLLAEGPELGGAGSRFTCRTIKVHYDGALGSGGAALLEPYADRPGSGFVKYDDDTLLLLFERALRAGVQVETHCIGDRANRNILSLYERAFDTVTVGERGQAAPRWRIEYAQILAEEDMPRFVHLGVIPSMQPSHAITDLHFAANRLGIQRLSGAYAWRKLIDAGATIAGGSDAPVEQGDPVIELYAAMYRKDPRRDPTGIDGPGWHPELRVGPEEALRMFTEWSAYAAFEETWRGTLEVGKACDLSVFSRDPLHSSPREWLGAKCLLTIVAGEVVYDGREP